MQYVSFYAVRHDTGAALPLATVTVLVSGTTTPALLFNEDGDSIGNPMTATAGGLVGFRTYNGEYDIQISSGSYSAPPITAMSVVDVIEVAADVELIKAGSLLGGVLLFETTAGLADLAHDAGTLAVVENDTPANGAVYQKTGASGAGSWTKTDLAIFSGRVDYFSTVQTNSSGSAYQLEVVGGFGSVRDIANALFAVDVTVAKPAEAGVTIEVQGLNDGDPRQLKTPDGGQIPDGAWVVGQRLLFKWTGAEWMLVLPEASAGGGGAPVMATQTNVSGYEFVLSPQGPFATGSTLLFEIVTEKPPEVGVTVIVEGFNDGDPRQLRLNDGSQTPDGTWEVGDLIAIRYGEDGHFYLKPFVGTGSGGGGGGGSLSYYQQVQALRTNASAAAARRIAADLKRSKLDVQDPTFEGVLSIGGATWQGTNPSFVHARTIGVGDTASSPHAFSDSAALSFGASLAYNSFESRFQVSGSGNYHHFSGFQANFTLATTGTTTDVWAFFSAPVIDDGTVTNAYGLEVMSFRGDATYVNVYGVLIRALDRGTNRYGIKQEGATDRNDLAGPLEVRNMMRASGNGLFPTTGAGTEIVWNASAFSGAGAGIVQAVDRTGTAAYKKLVVSGSDLHLRTGDFDRLTFIGTIARLVGCALAYADEVSIAAAATTNIGALAGNLVAITGNTTITAFDAVSSGAFREVRFTGTPVLTHNATSFILPGGANITAAAGDTALFLSIGGGNWRCLRYTRATGKAVVETPAPDLASPAIATVLRDEFMICTAEGGEVGELGWNIGGAGSGAAAIACETGHPGMIFRNTGATINTIATLFMGAGASTAILNFADFAETTWVVKPSAADADHKVRFGIFADVSSDTPTHGVYFERLGTDTNWQAVCRNGGTETRANMGVAYGAGVWATLKIRKVDASTVAFSVNGGAETTITTNVPDAADGMGPGCQIMNTAASDKSMRLDFFSLKTVPLAR